MSTTKTKTSTPIEDLESAVVAAQRVLDDVAHDAVALPKQRRDALVNGDAVRASELRRSIEDLDDRMTAAEVLLQRARSVLTLAQAEELSPAVVLARAVVDDLQAVSTLVGNDPTRSRTDRMGAHVQLTDAMNMLRGLEAKCGELRLVSERSLKKIVVLTSPTIADQSPVVKSLWHTQVSAADRWGNR